MPRDFQIIDHRADDGREVGDASAADADGDARAGFEIGAELGCCEFAGDRAGDVGEGAVGKVLPDGDESGERHN